VINQSSQRNWKLGWLGLLLALLVLLLLFQLGAGSTAGNNQVIQDEPAGTVLVAEASGTTEASGSPSPPRAELPTPAVEPESNSPLITTLETPAQNRADEAAIYWGVYMARVPYEMGYLDELESSIGKRVSIVQFGRPWQQSSTFLRFPSPYMSEIHDRGSIPMINWGSWHLDAGPEQPDFQLRDLADGRYDDYVRGWATAARDWGHPFFLKFNHEMNGWWHYPWSVQLNGNQPEDYVAAWRHVHDIFDEVGADNVTWVWCPITVSARTTPLEEVYPGNEYVDWTCIHGYNAEASAWRSFGQVIRGHQANPYNSYEQVMGLAPDKPMMLGGFATREADDGGAAKAAWIRDALDVQIPRRYANIRAIVWFNWNAQPFGTWGIGSSQAATEAFAASISAPVYAANDFRALSTSPIPPPGQ
jgi:mannan endo-1,4-beta-mannosidase